MDLSARKLVLELLSATPLDIDALPIRSLVRVAAAFGLGDNSVRVAVTRLCAEGRLDSPRRGEYCLGVASRPIHERVVSWRSLDTLLGTWAGAWIGAITGGVPKSDRKRQRAQGRALALWGFRELAPGMSIRPANLALPTNRLRERLYELGVDPAVPVMRVSELGPLDSTAHDLWDGNRLDATYRSLADALEQSDARLHELALSEAVRESFLLGREAIRVLVLDPLLPEPMVSGAQRQRLLDAMRSYDQRGRVLWRRYLLEDVTSTKAAS